MFVAFHLSQTKTSSLFWFRINFETANHYTSGRILWAEDQRVTSQNSGSHDEEYEDDSLLGYVAV
jgi:hypothetical protein